MFRVTPIRFAFFKCPRIPPQVRTRISTKWHQLSSHVPGYPHKFEQESLQNESMEKWVYNQTLHYTRIASTKWLNPSPFFGQNPARHRMMVYAGHVPSHFVPEISRGIYIYIYTYMCMGRFFSDISPNHRSFTSCELAPPSVYLGGMTHDHVMATKPRRGVGSCLV